MKNSATFCDTNTATAAIIATSDTLQGCWIIYSNSQGNERLTITKRSGSSESTITTGTSDSSESSFDINSIKYMLDSHLRPVTPDPNSRISQEIYADHVRKMQEYLKVQTELAYAIRQKKELLEKMTPKQREEQQKILKLLKEKEEIQKWRDTMMRQCEVLNLPRPQPHQPDIPSEEVDEGFILIPKK